MTLRNVSSGAELGNKRGPHKKPSCYGKTTYITLIIVQIQLYIESTLKFTPNAVIFKKGQNWMKPDKNWTKTELEMDIKWTETGLDLE